MRIPPLICAAWMVAAWIGCQKKEEAIQKPIMPPTEPPANLKTNTTQQPTVDPKHKHTNRLIKEKSPYLLQHAHNPVDWYPWGKEAFEAAKKADKPIFLSIGYSTCHWCHVMERESFEDEEVGALLNKHFICVKLDREERPDIDALYMDAVHILNRNNGGWPASSLVHLPNGTDKPGQLSLIHI